MRKDDYMKKTILILALVLSLALVGCQNSAEKAKEATEALNAVILSAEDAAKTFTAKYARASIDEISFQMEEGSYVYEINGFGDAKEYDMAIDAADGSIIMDESENDRNDGDKAIDLALLGNVNELIESAKADAGEGFYLDSYSIDVEDNAVTVIDIEVKDANGKDIEYEYNLETKELIKKDK